MYTIVEHFHKPIPQNVYCIPSRSQVANGYLTLESCLVSQDLSHFHIFLPNAELRVLIGACLAWYLFPSSMNLCDKYPISLGRTSTKSRTTESLIRSGQTLLYKGDSHPNGFKLFLHRWHCALLALVGGLNQKTTLMEIKARLLCSNHSNMQVLKVFVSLTKLV